MEKAQYSVLDHWPSWPWSLVSSALLGHFSIFLRFRTNYGPIILEYDKWNIFREFQRYFTFCVIIWICIFRSNFPDFSMWIWLQSALAIYSYTQPNLDCIEFGQYNCRWMVMYLAAVFTDDISRCGGVMLVGWVFSQVVFMNHLRQFHPQGIWLTLGFIVRLLRLMDAWAT